ncbi:hypothetical protein GC089_01215 [Cellulomonas sp. JZ18]|uniref:hypothetical protein n=1 Tax=Cellulomonas sp. JZ18 TaxID=2654191 RepID=UPI0012D4392D|nr:hypothetical protein [Cellulomonas sp. JZ18]QGQ18138.1 hypothetical protein GC089_01215 [Cellulomonas sp. JZ18]
MDDRHRLHLALLGAGVLTLGLAGQRLAQGASGALLVVLVAAVLGGGAAVVVGLLGLVSAGRDD